MNTGSDAVRDILSAITGRPPNTIDEQDRLTDLGMDSLDRVLLAVLIEERSGRSLPDTALASMRTVADIRQHLQPTECPR